MSREGIWTAVVVALVGLGATWFFLNFERVAVRERVGMSGEARRNPYLALERLSERMGQPARELRSLAELGDLPPRAVLLLRARAPSSRAASATGCSSGSRAAARSSSRPSRCACPTRSSTRSASSASGPGSSRPARCACSPRRRRRAAPRRAAGDAAPALAARRACGGPRRGRAPAEDPVRARAGDGAGGARAAQERRHRPARPRRARLAARARRRRRGRAPHPRPAAEAVAGGLAARECRARARGGGASRRAVAVAHRPAVRTGRAGPGARAAACSITCARAGASCGRPDRAAASPRRRATPRCAACSARIPISRRSRRRSGGRGSPARSTSPRRRRGACSSRSRRARRPRTSCAACACTRRSTSGSRADA